MKKALLAVAVMATFGSASAFAAFGGATESTGDAGHTGKIAISGTINPATATWMTDIDEDPFAAKKEVDFNAWTGSAGQWTYLVESNPLPLVYTHTKTSSIGGYPTPAIRFGVEGASQTVDVLSAPSGAPVEMKGIVVEMDPALGTTYVPTTDTTVEALLSVTAGWAESMTDGSIDKWVTTETAGAQDFKSDLDKIIVSVLPGASGVGSKDFSNIDWATIVRNVAGGGAAGRVSQATAAVVGSTTNGIKLVSTRQGRPTGTWQATIPVQVTYN